MVDDSTKRQLPNASSRDEVASVRTNLEDSANSLVLTKCDVLS